MERNTETHKIDASGKILGRLATEAANLLRGKGKTNFEPNLVSGDKVIIYNASEVKLTGRKLEQKKYAKHSGYLGHLTFETAKVLYENKPEEIVKRAIKGMLPKNKLQQVWLNNLTIFRKEEK